MNRSEEPMNRSEEPMNRSEETTEYGDDGCVSPLFDEPPASSGSVMVDMVSNQSYDIPGYYY